MSSTTGGRYVFAEGVEQEVREHAVSFLEGRAADVLGEGTVKIERLQGGACNVNLRLTAGDSRYALRLCDDEAERWGVVRAASIQAQQEAHHLGLAPRIVASELPRGDFLAEFADGVQMNAAMLADDALVARVAQTLRALNAGTTTSRDFSPFDDARTFIEYADAEKAPRPDRYDEMLARLLRIEGVFQNRNAPRGFCHSDSVPQNYLVSDTRIQLVDFDYAGYGWTAFELGSLCCQAELDDDRTSALLKAYDPDADDGQRARVELMRFVAGVREAAWALMAEPILRARTTTLDGWSYQDHAARNIRQAAQVVDSGAFEIYLDQARAVRGGALC
ncbi:phosphotransferase [Streptomyces cacaoi]|uniref:phosphotransferase n=1 Tax=Streptomyces cacaoi TaxID=1898 RepID=UPI00374A48D6